MKFNHLNVPSHWEHYWTRYPEGYTILEALLSWVKQVDDMVDSHNATQVTVNTYGERLDDFINQFDTDLQNTVTTILADWQSSGFLDIVISEALQWQLDDFTAQLANITTNPNFKTVNANNVLLGNEILSSAGVQLGAGWSGSVGTGFTHTEGFTENLVFNSSQFSKDKLYLITVDISKPNPVDMNGQSDYFLSLGGSPIFETYQGIVTKQLWGIKHYGNNQSLAIIPYENFNGTLRLSVKEITGKTPVQMSIETPQGETIFEYRHSTAGNKSIYMGKNAGQYSLNGLNEENVAVGYEALSTNTGGFWNTAIGSQTLVENTVGSRNVAVGRLALKDNVSGDRNIALGTFALTRNKTGRNNIAIGADTLWYNERGEGNIAIGLLSLGGSTERNAGNNNIALGIRAMQSGTNSNENIGIGKEALATVDGLRNIGIGSEALIRIAGGILNVAIGYKAGRNKFAGEENVIIGNQSMALATGGHRNIGIGSFTLENATSHENIAIGHQALRNIKGGRGNIAIGFGAMYGSDDGIVGEQNIAIGEGAYRRSKGNRNIIIGVNSLNALEEGNQNIAIGNGAGSESVSGGSNVLIGYNVQKSSPTATNEVNIGDVYKGSTLNGLAIMRRIQLTALPTSAPAERGMLWNDNGTVKIV